MILYPHYFHKYKRPNALAVRPLHGPRADLALFSLDS